MQLDGEARFFPDALDVIVATIDRGAVLASANAACPPFARMIGPVRIWLPRLFVKANGVGVCLSANRPWAPLEFEQDLSGERAEFNSVAAMMANEGNGYNGASLIFPGSYYIPKPAGATRLESGEELVFKVLECQSLPRNAFGGCACRNGFNIHHGCIERNVGGSLFSAYLGLAQRVHNPADIAREALVVCEVLTPRIATCVVPPQTKHYSENCIMQQVAARKVPQTKLCQTPDREVFQLKELVGGQSSDEFTNPQVKRFLHNCVFGEVLEHLGNTKEKE